MEIFKFPACRTPLTLIRESGLESFQDKAGSMKRLLLAGLLLHSSGPVLGASVTSIDPRDIGEGGGTIVIHGDGFATDGFSQFDPSKGNKVKRVKIEI